MQPDAITSLLRRICLLPAREQSLTVEFRPVQINARYTTGVADVLKRVRIEHDEVSALTHGECSHVFEPQQFCRTLGRGRDRLRRCQPKLHPSRQFDMLT